MISIETDPTEDGPMIKYSSKNSQDKMVQIQSIQSSTRALSILYIKNQGEGIKEKKRD
jgi:hypothetical protein